MPKHLHAGRECEHPTKRACEAARREAMGRCSAMTESAREPTACRNWGVERVNDRAYCGQHVASIVIRRDRELREAAKRERLDRTLTAFLDWTAAHPSVWDRMPVDTLSREF